MVFDIREKEEEEVIIVELLGELDSSSVTIFNLRFREISEKYRTKKYIFDMKGLKFISSAGWTAILKECNRLRMTGGDLKIVSMQEDARRAYGLIGIDNVIKSYETMKEALKSYEKND